MRSRMARAAVAPAMNPLLGFAALGGVFVVAGAALAIVLAIRSKR